MTRFRNVLIAYGAVVGAANLVRLIVNSWFRPRPWSGAGTDTATIAWMLGSAAVSAAIAGCVAGIAFDSPRPGRWAALVACLAALEDSPSIPRFAFSGFGAWGQVTWVCLILASTVALGCFALARLWHARPQERAA